MILLELCLWISCPPKKQVSIFKLKRTVLTGLLQARIVLGMAWEKYPSTFCWPCFPRAALPLLKRGYGFSWFHAAWFIATFMHLRTLAQLHSRLPHHEIPLLSLLVTVLKTCAESKFKPVSVFYLSGSIVIENFEGKEGLLFSHLPYPDFHEHKS